MSTPRKTAANASPVDGLVDCETCRHFTGSVGWASSSWGSATRADFDAYRVWQNDKRAASASVAALVANAKASGGESS